jgi:mannose/fructose/N-acetylgalactosamine-specific phosphotransferase system component IIB
VVVGAAPGSVVFVIVLSRIDSRLVHGQVIEAWLPHLKVARVVVADDATAADGLARAAMSLAVPTQVEVRLSRIDEVDWATLAGDPVRTLVLFKDVAGAVAARHCGLPNGPLNLGNVHAGPGRQPLSRSVFLSPEERSELERLRGAGMDVVIQAIPSEKPQPV